MLAGLSSLPRRCVLLVVSLVLLTSTFPALAQDTPREIREPAIADLNTRVPGIGRPTSWQHQLLNTRDGNLGCPLAPANATQFSETVQVFIVTLNYEEIDTNYVYHVKGDGTLMVPCDAKLGSIAPIAITPPPTTPAPVNPSISSAVPPTAILPTTRVAITSTNVNQVQLLARLAFQESITSVQVGQNGTLAVATTNEAGTTVYIYGDLDTGLLNPVQTIAFPLAASSALHYRGLSEGGTLGISTTGDGTLTTGINLFDPLSGAASPLRPSVPVPQFVLKDIAFTADDGVMALAYETPDGRGGLVLYDFATGVTASANLPESIKLSKLAFSADGQWLAGYDGVSLYVWNMAVPTAPTLSVQSIINQTAPVEIAFNADASKIAISSGASGSVAVFDVATRTLGSQSVVAAVATNFTLPGLAFSPDGNLMAVGGALTPLDTNLSNPVFLFDTANFGVPTPVPALRQLEGQRYVGYLAFSADGSLLVTHDNLSVLIWGVAQN